MRRISFRGNDSGFVLLTTVFLILGISFLFFAVVPQILIAKTRTVQPLEHTIERIEQENSRIRGKYDLH
ncbi:MAG: hypothetical protein P1P65_06245 [Treponema sp.]